MYLTIPLSRTLRYINFAPTISKMLCGPHLICQMHFSGGARSLTHSRYGHLKIHETHQISVSRPGGVSSMNARAILRDVEIKSFLLSPLKRWAQVQARGGAYFFQNETRCFRKENILEPESRFRGFRNGPVCQKYLMLSRDWKCRGRLQHANLFSEIPSLILEAHH